MNTRHLFRRLAPCAAALAFAAFAGGCAALGSNYKRPDMEPPAQFRGVEAPARPPNRWPTCRGGRCSRTRCSRR